MTPLSIPRLVAGSFRRLASRIHPVLSTVERGLCTLGNRLIDVHPVLALLLVRSWYLYVYLYVRTVATRNAIRYEAEIDPLRLYWVDLDRLERKLCTAFPKRKYKYFGKVMDGDWDRESEPFEETDVYRSFEAHFERGVEWQETPFFQRVLGEIRNGQTQWGCDSREAFLERCAEIDELYERIRTEGYKTQAELLNDDGAEPLHKARHSRIYRYVTDEMTVSVARDGELIFNDARNRLAIAKVLDLDEVPVRIMVRHARWQRLRDAVATGERDLQNLPEELRTHPDLRN